MKKTKLVYATLAFAVTAQFGIKGYIFTLDWVPVLSYNEILKNLYGLKPPIYGGSLPLQLLNLLLPTWIFQRLAIFFILLLCGISADLLAGRFVKSDVAKLYAGLLYMINPFTYIRFLVGHWIILFSYSLLPTGVYFFLEMLECKDLEYSIKFAFIQTLIGFNAHMLVISILIYALVLCVLRKITKNLFLAIFMFFALSAYWIIPFVTYRGQTLLTHISAKDIIAFAPKGPIFSIMAMYGFWKIGYIYAKDFLNFFWMYIFLLIFSLTVLGFVTFKNRDIALIFALVWVVGFAFASGVRGPFSHFMTFLFEKTILKGMRDSQKFVAMLVLSYSILGAVGVEFLRRYWKKITLLLLIVPLVYSFTFFNCFAGQIHPCDFPKDWYKVRTYLDSDTSEFRILFFPWHLYMYFHWAKDSNKLIANPAPVFFDKDVISAKNIEIPGVYTEVYTPYQVYVMKLLKNRSKIKNFGELVGFMGVKYVLLTKEGDYRHYFFLFNQSDLKLVLETKNFYIFKNLDFKGLAFIKNGKKEVKVVTISPAEVVVKTPSGLLIYTWQYDQHWNLNGEKPFPVRDVVCGFRINKQYRGKIIYSRFYTVLLSYIVSVVSSLILGYLFFRRGIS